MSHHQTKFYHELFIKRLLDKVVNDTLIPEVLTFWNLTQKENYVVEKILNHLVNTNKLDLLVQECKFSRCYGRYGDVFYIESPFMHNYRHIIYGYSDRQCYLDMMVDTIVKFGDEKLINVIIGQLKEEKETDSLIAYIQNRGMLVKNAN